MITFRNLVHINGYSGELIFKKKLKKVFSNDDKMQNVLILKDLTEEIKNNEAFVLGLILVLLISLLNLILVLHLQRKNLEKHLPRNIIICTVSILLTKNVCSINNTTKRILDLLANYLLSKHQI